MRQYFPPYRSHQGDLKNVTHVDVTSFASKQI